jgi:hypothetical protein
VRAGDDDPFFPNMGDGGGVLRQFPSDDEDTYQGSGPCRRCVLVNNWSRDAPYIGISPHLVEGLDTS